MLMWLLVVWMGCERREVSCPSLDAVVHPLREVRAEGRRFSPKHPGHWDRRVQAEQLAVTQVQALAPDLFPAALLSAYVDVLHQQAVSSGILLESSHGLQTLYGSQERLRRQIDEQSEALQKRCGQVDGGCVFAPARPDHPGEGDGELQAFVEEARKVHVHDAEAEGLWLALLDLLELRIQAVKQEASLLQKLDDQHQNKETLEQNEQALYEKLAAVCPDNPQVP